MAFQTYLVQHDILWEEKAGNYGRVEGLLDAAGVRAGGLIVLPEMFATGFSKDLAVTQEAVGGETEGFLSHLARRFGCHVVAGLVGTGESGSGQNQALVLDAGGEVVGRYVKQQPFSLGGECAVHERGKGGVVVEALGLKLAPLVCYDLRFPELARAVVGAGAELLVYVASWPIKRAEHWVTLLRARAIENQAWVIGVNRCGADPEFSYRGDSMLVDPHGNILCSGADREGVVCGVVDVELVRGWRRDFPALRDAGLL